MPSYFDTSVVLSLVVGDVRADRAFELWSSELERVSSVLTEIECVTVLRRLSAGWSSTAVRAAQARLDSALEEMALKPLDEEIVEKLRAASELTGCRNLDAAHLATALYFQTAADSNLTICTFDARMAEAAARVGLTCASI
ncbi:MAG: PIN domain-containing protein [Myxococcota bacterium]